MVPCEGYRQWFRVLLRADGDVGDGRLQGWTAAGMCGASSAVSPCRSFFSARFFGHNDWKWPVCLQPLHSFPAAGQGDLVCAVRP